MSGISSSLQCDPVEISIPSYAGAPLDIAGQILCAEQWLQCLSSFLFSCHISSTFYVNIYFSRLFSFLQSFSLGRSDFKSSPEQFLSLEAKAICIAAGVLMD